MNVFERDLIHVLYAEEEAQLLHLLGIDRYIGAEDEDEDADADEDEDQDEAGDEVE